MELNESPNQREFIKLYNEVHKLLSEKFFGKTDKFVSFSRCIDEIAKRKSNYYLTQHIEELRLINDFRNLIVHKTTNKFYNIADPSDNILKILSTIKNMLDNPIKISKVVEKNNIISFDINDKLIEVFDHISRDNISQFPVFDENKLVGMITDNGLTNFIASHIHDEGFLSQKHTIKEVIGDEKTDEYKNAYKILYSELELDRVIDEFLDLKQDIHYVLVTKSGNNHIRSKNDLVDIITSSDIPEILKVLEN